MKDLVSILIPVFNRECFIAETLHSALNQTYQEIEVVVVDNCSTDSTWDIIQAIALKDSRVKCFRNESNIGPVRNWKRCIDEANGVYGKILWSDDLIHERFIEETVAEFNKDVAFVYTAVGIFSDNPKEYDVYFSQPKNSIISSSVYIESLMFEEKHPRSPGCAIFRLQDLRNNLLINIPNTIGSDFSMHAIGNDSLIFLLTANEYKNVVVINQVMSFFRAHPNSISESSENGKLQLHYLLSDSYFIENKRPEYVVRNNSKIYIYLRRFYRITAKYNIFSISDFYVDNKNYKFTYTDVLRIAFCRLLRK
ncbi:glycosyltransferase family 2 protein [Vibrio cholerae]|uniref:glycosyltransferase family 2 protein n=1 Tax=Vibrio cholerae TaxID=666 RepID=UPI000D5D72A0|nr:glycosyltransferase family 2 protein [Vibrio cholerae]EIY4765827.1 glycosyltransferase family 2 protein [Vibrio cholerae]PVX18378.1 glycosyltransferase family 2 protein [Vibrio cholerae]